MISTPTTAAQRYMHLGAMAGEARDRKESTKQAVSRKHVLPDRTCKMQ